jgi:hypothetical protein
MAGVSLCRPQRRGLARQRQNRQTIPYTSELVEKRLNYIAAKPACIHPVGPKTRQLQPVSRKATLQRAWPKTPGPDLQMKYISVLI